MYTIKIKADIKKLRKKERKKERIVRTLFLNTPFRYIYTHIYIGNNPTNRILIPRPKESIKITESNILDIKKFAISSIYLNLLITF
jgi:hypothetical protein